MTRFPDATIVTVLARADGACEVRGQGCTWRVVDLQHRRAKGAGGRPGAKTDHTHCACNAVACCRTDHRAVEGDLQFHREHTGLSVYGHEPQPFAVPVRLWDGWWWLWCDGTKTECPRADLDRLDLADRTEETA